MLFETRDFPSIMKVHRAAMVVVELIGALEAFALQALVRGMPGSVVRPQRFRSHPVAQELAHHIMEPDGSRGKIEGHQEREFLELAHQLVAGKIGEATCLRPKPDDRPDGNVLVLGKDREFLETGEVIGAEMAQAGTNGKGRSSAALGLVGRIECGQADLIVDAADKGDRLVD